MSAPFSPRFDQKIYHQKLIKLLPLERYLLEKRSILSRVAHFTNTSKPKGAQQLQEPMFDFSSLQWYLIRTFVNSTLSLRRSAYFSPSTQPDLTRTYTCRPHLYPARIFLPSSHDHSEPDPVAAKSFPLIIRVHGGGFVLNNPSVDDPLARHLADHARCVVVSIDYSKSPQSKFPTAYEDVIALSLAVMADQDLPIGRTKVVLCGSSAGGNLVLAAAQDVRLREKIVGVAAIYPLVDLVPDGSAKMATRPDLLVPDFLGEESYDGVQKLYLDSTNGAAPSLKDPRVSPTYFASRKSLPGRVLLIGAEHDLLCAEAEAMAEKLAASAGGERRETAAGWRARGVWWHRLYGQRHAFEGFPEKDPGKERERLEKVEEMYALVCEWFGDVFAGA